jgi:hypothetical protein
MDYLFIFLGSYFVCFVFAWIWAAKRMRHAAMVLKNTGVSEKGIDDFYKEMSKPTWLMSIRLALIAGTVLGIIASIILAVVS